MNKTEAVRAWALARVGNPYIMGGTGQFCTPAYRKARAAQYPASASKITKNCQRMRGDATSCRGCRYYDEAAQTGKRAYDCAQFTRWAMDHVGISLVSGATSQWQRTHWEQIGEIDTIPAGKMCLVFRQDSPGKMGHVGLALGDGSVVHAKGHDYGVVREGLDSYGRFTHWGIPQGLYSDTQDKTEQRSEYEVTGTRLALREGMTTSSRVLARMETGTILRGTPATPEWIATEYNGIAGFAMAQYLRLTDPQDAADDAPDDDASSAAPLVSIAIPRETVEALKQAIDAVMIGG